MCPSVFVAGLPAMSRLKRPVPKGNATPPSTRKAAEALPKTEIPALKHLQELWAQGVAAAVVLAVAVPAAPAVLAALPAAPLVDNVALPVHLFRLALRAEVSPSSAEP